MKRQRRAMIWTMGISPQGAEHLTMKICRAYKHVKEFDALVVAHCTRSDLFNATARDSAAVSLPREKEPTVRRGTYCCSHMASWHLE